MPIQTPDKETPLSMKLRARAAIDATNYNQLTVVADALDRVANDPHSSVPKIVGTWAKARRVWCDVTGEPLM